ncbi:MAG: hypothetical protein ACTSX9_00735 [Candidatus Njordarchaeales archaeon]
MQAGITTGYYLELILYVIGIILIIALLAFHYLTYEPTIVREEKRRRRRQRRKK